MENDSVRTVGDRTLVDLWIDGKSRAISVSRQAIEAWLRLPPDRRSILSEDERSDFVRTHLGLLAQAARERLRADPDVETVTVDAFGAGATPVQPPGERRQGERRKGDRRQRNGGPPGGVERRS